MSTEAPEGVVQYSTTSGNIDYTDILGRLHSGIEYLGLTDNNIETIDLISEGIIDGPLSGRWIFSGNLGQTGWSSAYFSGYQVPTGFESLRWLRSVYWNQVPVLSDAGQFNFQNTNLAYCAGTPNGDILQQLTNEETTSRTIGTRLYATIAQTFRILNRNCKGVIVNIKFSALNNTNNTNTTNAGNIERTRVDYSISYRPIFSDITKITQFFNPTTKTVFGKIASAGGYIDSTRINFNLTSFYFNNTIANDFVGFLNEPDFIGWEIVINRITADSGSALLANASFIDSITELYGSQFSYPNSAMVRATFDAKFFSQIPERAFECNFIKVKIPANYNPILRTYATTGYGTTNGYWNGTFASGKAWTNNPAWCFYDLITNTRYGLGKYVENIDINKFDLYNISQYCDELVADGYGFLEPRFTSNVWIAQKEDAFKVINDMASIFRGLVYYFNGNLNATQDSPKTPRIAFTNSNIENGDFNYSSTSKKTRQSIAVIRYNDPKNYYSPAIEYVEDVNFIRRYGIRELPLVAFGCTSRGQAIRLGKWALYSNNIETETVSFTAGLEANLLRCGDLFEVTDYNRKLKRYGGRIIQLNNTGYTGIGFTGATLTLDSNIGLDTGVQYNISLVTPTFYYDTSQVTGLTSNDYSNIYRSFLQTSYFSGDATWQSGANTIVNLQSGFDSTNYNLTGNAVWSISLGPNSLNYTGNYYFSNSQNDYYRVLNIKETDSNKYEIIGISYYPDKFIKTDSGIAFQQNQFGAFSARVPSSPRNLSLGFYRLNNTNSQSYIQYSFLVDDYTNISNFKVYAITGNAGFVGGVSSVPPDANLIALLPPSIINATYVLPLFNTATGVLYNFRVYGFNSSTTTYSTGCGTGAILVTQSPPINDVIIGGLGLN